MTPPFPTAPLRSGLLRSLPLLALIGVSFPCLRAAPPAGVERSFRLISQVGSRLDLKYEVSRTLPPVSISLSQAVSRAYPAPAGGRLELFREIPPPPDSPPGTKAVRQIILSTRLPDDALRCLLVTLPTGSKPGDPLTARVLPDGPDRHPAGTMLVVNLSRFQTAVKLGDDTQQFAVGEARLLPLAQGKLRVSVQAAVQKDGQWQPAARTARRIVEGVRGFLFISDYLPDPDYPADPEPSPALVRIFTEVAPRPNPPSPSPAS